MRTIMCEAGKQRSSIISFAESNAQRARSAQVKELLLERLVSMEEAQRICRNALKDAKEMIDDLCFPASHDRAASSPSLNLKAAVISINHGVFDFHFHYLSTTIFKQWDHCPQAGDAHHHARLIVDDENVLGARTTHSAARNLAGMDFSY